MTHPEEPTGVTEAWGNGGWLAMTSVALLDIKQGLRVACGSVAPAEIWVEDEDETVHGGGKNL